MNMHASDCIYPGEMAHTVTKAMIDDLLKWTVQQHRASDIVLSAEDPIWMQVDGIWRLCSALALTQGELNTLVGDFAGGAHQSGKVQTGESIDFAYAVRLDRKMWQRFRVNVTNSNKGAYIVMRALPLVIPQIADLRLEADIVRHIYPSCGLVILSGVMGSGKSTFLAGVVHTAILTLGRQVLTLEHPIEFDFSEIPFSQRSAPITQSGIGQHVESWTSGVRTMTRRKGEIVMVGEARDQETLKAMISTVEQGVTAYSTVHAQDVPQTVTRIINAFNNDERPSMTAALKANLRLIVHQRLVARTGRTQSDIAAGVPGRIALREFLPFTESIRRRLYQTPFADLLPAIRDMVSAEGQSLLQDAERKHKAGMIAEETYLAVRHEQEVALDVAA
ncbi:MAG: Flp pilus assembly complex ATPase component TadA [Deltaproteobacteria bacterium]|jgi:Tfp pilus assembly pilus retraction ATPase PilT|nr:Flp pilus assembly complex ATPase component TadA [Deltaproteobacteria bacterium]